MDIIGIGESGVDILVKVDRIPSRGEKSRGEEIGRFPGGIIGNFCSAVANHGIDCGIVSVVGDDENGEISLSDYKSRGIDVSNIAVKKGGKTFYCIVFIDKSGEKTLTAVVTPLISPAVEDIDFAYLKQAKYVHMTSMDYTLSEHVVHNLITSGTKISIDYEAHAENGGFDNWKTILKHVNTLFVNEGGMANLFPDEDVEAAATRLLGLGIEQVVLTCGAEGGIVFTEEKTVRFAAYKVREIKDTTGAGDCFNAAFLSAQLKGKSLEEAVNYASASSAIAIQYVGARTGLPTEQQVEEFLIQRKQE
ncbi:carbohydrate kinase family protein [Neobacillus notoginsengisoli]|uniref:carbohydrate kinase family protein n=1 Tax=Neobacillus notoginsengisoli TaxID=1578198 RepID=UPI001314C394|nr:carbohydrate kinase family protein [Neobacillus notoginsengisoli]